MTGRPRQPGAIRLSLTRRGLALLVLAAAVCALWAAVRLRDLLALAALVAAVLVVALAWLVLIRMRMRARAEVSSDLLTPAVGDTVTTTASVRHGLPFSQSAELMWEGPHGGRILPLLLPRLGEARQTAEWSAERRGPLPLAASALVVSDPWGIARVRIPLGARTEVLVLPTLLPAEHLPPGLAGRAGARGAASGPAADSASGSGRGGGSAEEAGGGLREYRAGDPPRRVHWKQSARQDRLLVNVPEHGAGEQLAIALMLDPGAYRGPGAEAEHADFEHAVSLAATLVTLRAGPGGARGGDGRRVAVTLCTVRSAGGAPVIERSTSSVADALRALARAEPASDPARSGDGGIGSPAFRPTAIVTGAVTPAVAALASRSSAGIVVAVSAGGRDPGPRTALPPGWELVRARRADETTSRVVPAGTARTASATNGPTAATAMAAPRGRGTRHG
ncbi:DUF58 domain-containing protein [Leucobacter sp.]